jgi:hypothetical protein
MWIWTQADHVVKFSTNNGRQKMSMSMSLSMSVSMDTDTDMDRDMDVDMGRFLHLNIRGFIIVTNSFSKDNNSKYISLLSTF